MVSLQKVRAEEAGILHNLMQFYVYEFSIYLPQIKLEDNGRYKPFDLEEYWNNPHFHAYFIKMEEELIGFALVESAGASGAHSIQEFFVMAKHKGKGYGKQAAKKLFAMFPGEWEITQIEKNEPARAFWKGLIHEVSGGDFKENFNDGVYVQRFRL